MAKGIQYSFERYEKKYFLNEAQYGAVLGELQKHMKADDYGQYTICNIYYDTDDWRLIRASIDKPLYKEKLRVRAMLRRSDNYRPSALEFGDVTLDPSTGLLACSGRSVRLSGREYQVMELFMRSPNVVFSADKIMERVWGWDSDAEINVIWVHISNLRKKLRSIGSKITIRAVRGLGYALEESDD